jgi:hypothetical protein
VNESLFRGNLEGLGIAEFICNSLEKYDDKCLRLIDPNYIFDEEKSNGLPIIWTIFFIIFGFFILFVVVIYAYKKVVKREISQGMNQQVNQMVSQYIAFYESRGKGSSDQSEL